LLVLQIVDYVALQGIPYTSGGKPRREESNFKTADGIMRARGSLKGENVIISNYK
jgi:hypothetical protein